MSEKVGKLALVTGGSRGLGFVAAKRFAQAGFRVILTSRSEVRAEEAATTIRRELPGAAVQGLALDLSSLEDVRAFAERFATRERALHLLVANAANMPYTKKPEVTENGLEKTFATNHLGHFLLVTKLFPSLESAARETGEARVVVVSSRLHQPKSIGPGVRFDFGDPNLTHRYHPMVAYKNSKLANLWFTYELNRRVAGSGVTANALCPGFVPATIADEARELRRFRFRHILSRLPFARTPTEATDTYLFVGAHPSLKGTGGNFFAEGRPIHSSLESYDEDKAAWLWALSEQLVGQA